MTLKPNDIAIPENGLLTGTLGSMEKEAVALAIVRFHQFRDLLDWSPIRLRDFIRSVAPEPADQAMKTWTANPLWMRGLLHGMEPLLAEGYVEGWVRGDGESGGTVTPKFIAAIQGSHWDKFARKKARGE